MQPRIQYARNGDIHLAYQVVGAGPIDMLSIFGYPFAPPLDSWQDQPVLGRAVNDLASFSRLILWDPRGIGLSDRVGKPHPIEDQVADALTVLDASDSDRAVVIGWEPGGLLAMVLAAMRPERVSALVLFNAYATTLQEPDYPWGQTIEDRAADIEAIAERWGTGLELDWIAPSVAGDEPFRAWWSGMVMRFMSPRDVPAYYGVLGEIDARSALALISAPTLILHRPDSWMQVENSRYLAGHIPGAEYRELPGVDSVAWLDGWEPLAAAIQEFVTGRPPETTVESALSTVLFTDIVGSTEMLTKVGDRTWAELLDRYEAVTDRELERFGGRLVDRAGDGLFATFDGPARAIRCAMALRDRARGMGVETRCGIHVGELSLSRERVRGLAVHVGARIVAEAGPGEVLVSKPVKDLVAGSGLDLVDRGEHRLKGIREEIRLFALADS